jgi:cytochrome c553
MFTFVPSHLSLCHGINISGLSQLGLPVDNLIGLSAHDLYFQLMHLRSSTNASLPSTS